MGPYKESRDEIIERFKPSIEFLIKYIPWLENQNGKSVAQFYRGSGIHKQFSVPVYDGTLLRFVDDALQTDFMDRNYLYVYTRYRIRDYKDEWKVIEQADIMHMDILCGILSKYVLGGMTKSVMWKSGVEYEIFLRILKKAKSIIEFWEVPLAEEEESSIDSQPIDMTALSEITQAAVEKGGTTLSDKMESIAKQLDELRGIKEEESQTTPYYEDEDDLSLEEIQRILNGED